LEPTEPKYRFGGLVESSEDTSENNPFMHILTLDPIPANIRISGLKRLILGMHENELTSGGAGDIFYQHDASGNPSRMEEAVEVDPSLIDLPIQETEISFAITPKQWHFQDDGLSSRENLFRLGGEPSWVQGEWFLDCPACHEKMDFLMQLSHSLPDSEGKEWAYFSYGMCYVFWCDKCKVSGYTIQYT
jgi:hypothetical protein